VEPHHLLGCSHKIPNRASVTSELSCCGIAAPSMALGLPRRSTVASNTTLGPCSQGSSRHLLPHAALGFFAGCGNRDWWSSLNFASILLAPRDDTLVLYSGGRTQDQGMAKLSSEGAMVPLLDFRSKGQAHLFIAMDLITCRHPSYRRRGNLTCNTVRTWSMRSLSAIGSTDTFATGLMTSFQSLSSSGGCGISARGQILCLHSAPMGCYTTTSFDTRRSSEKILVTLSYPKGRASISSSKRS
jgi:hypothetical protein